MAYGHPLSSPHVHNSELVKKDGETHASSKTHTSGNSTARGAELGDVSARVRPFGDGPRRHVGGSLDLAASPRDHHAAHWDHDVR